MAFSGLLTDEGGGGGGEQKSPLSLNSVTHSITLMKLGTIISYIKKIQKNT